MNSDAASSATVQMGAKGVRAEPRRFKRRVQARPAEGLPAESVRERGERVLGEIDTFLGYSTV